MAKKKKLPPIIDPNVRVSARAQRLAEAQNWRCPHCGGVMNDIRDHDKSATVEHVLPRSKGGPNSYLNTVAAHKSCNKKRGTRPVDRESMARAYIGALFTWRHHFRAVFRIKTGGGVYYV